MSGKQKQSENFLIKLKIACRKDITRFNVCISFFRRETNHKSDDSTFLLRWMKSKPNHILNQFHMMLP